MFEHTDRVVTEIRTERVRQMTSEGWDGEGWSVEHDDQHSDGQLARAAACYASPVPRRGHEDCSPPSGPIGWPWHWTWWKPKDRRRDLIRAAALIVAEIERLDRVSAAEQPKE